MHEAKNISLLLCDSYFMCAVMWCVSCKRTHAWASYRGPAARRRLRFCPRCFLWHTCKCPRPLLWPLPDAGCCHHGSQIYSAEKVKRDSGCPWGEQIEQSSHIPPTACLHPSTLWEDISVRLHQTCHCTEPQTLGNTNYILFLGLLPLFYLTVERRQKTIWEENGNGIKIQVSSLGGHLSSQTATAKAIYLNGKRLKSLKLLPKKALI